MCFICFIHSSNDRRKKGITEAKKRRRVLSFQCTDNLSYKPTFCVLQHKEHRLLGNDVLVQAHHVGHAAGDDGLSAPAAFAALPQTLTENKKVSCTLSCLWSLLRPVFINQTNLSELLWASEKPLICCSMPLGPWRLC